MEQTSRNNTPYFTFDLNKVRTNYREFITLLPGVSVFYAMKSNSHPEVLKALHNEGSGFEIASNGELKQLMDIGVEPSKIIYSNPVKARAAIQKAYHTGVRTFAFDSKQEVDKLSEEAPGCDVYIRVAVSEFGSRFSMSEKFGVLPHHAIPLAKYALEKGLNLTGLTFHVGSQAENLEQWRTAIGEVKEVIDALERDNIKLDFLDIGGGYPEAYVNSEHLPDLTDIAKEVSESLVTLPYKLKLYVEPGRRLVANAATLTVSVIASLDRDNEKWLFLDAGAYNGVFEAMIFQGNMRFEITPPSHRQGPLTRFVLTGPTCDSLDTISYDARLPEDVQEGDQIVLNNVGAYSLCFASNFNGFSIPAVHVEN